MTTMHTIKSMKKSKSKLLPSLGPIKSYITVDFQYKFQNYCLENDCRVVPHVQVEDQQKESVQFDEVVPLLWIAYKAGDDRRIERMCFKNLPLETSVLLAIERCLEDKQNISVLKLEFCNMSSGQIEILGRLLGNNTSITELSVSGNPNEDQNFNLLLQDTKLLILSLKCCSIDSSGLQKIAQELSKPFETTLLYLNLASNLLFDEGVEYIAKILRINRTLLSLNLADNKIYDEGCLTLIEPLKKFPLELEEIIVRRQIRYTVLKKSMELPRLPSYDSNADNSEISDKSSSIRSNKRSSKGSKDKASVASKESQGTKKSSSINQPNLEIESHPFVQDSYPENLEIFCKGNDVLTSLNLCYNRITKEGLNAIIQMMYYQRGTFADDKGISRISVEGNDFKNNCEQELTQLEDILARRSRRSSSIGSKNKSQASFRKRSSRPSSAVINTDKLLQMK